MLLVTPLVLLVISVAGLQNPHRVKPTVARPVASWGRKRDTSRTEHKFQYRTNLTEKFFVDGSNFPQVPFDIGESYAGLLPNTPHGNASLFFWFFPSTNPLAKKEITIWLNGGPGCSSLNGLLQENGPFLWQAGTYEPVRNIFAWSKLTNMVYIDQPAGTGFSPGPPTVENEYDVSNEFNDFWRRFIDAFQMQGYKVYMAGESYGGQYIPYIASGILDQKNREHFNLKGILLYDPSINEDGVMMQAPAVSALNYFSNVFNLNTTFMMHINQRADECGYTKFLDEALTYPPPKDFPTVPDLNRDGCDVWSQAVTAAAYVNPCFNYYHITDFCPYLWDQMAFQFLGSDPTNYFNRSDVQRALNVPPTNHAVCNTPFFAHGDASVPSALGPLPSVIERNNNVLISHAWGDYLLFLNGSLATIQNMTWNGAQGFQTPPVEDLFVPYSDSLVQLVAGTPQIPFTADAGAGILGTAHTERGLTFSGIFGSGHEVPQYTPGAAYRHLEFLLGRIHSLQDKSPFTAL
ncbi:Carboxypeptidase [Penicillium ucsense]|uniref:Carboxypeptidase n=1 Tax=Penicillium ucsense TaxID=2839758 RepID=A0A8J8WEI3_9EURO|nr:Carboxypeptidase [Penicillium ucsense]KAF7732968.1 Carboxypeptidase [Penicillium ucsense]